MRKLGIGVLGVGEMGKRHAENIRRLVPEARLAAVADVAAERASEVAAELEIEHSFRSFDAMLECKEVDAVLIATPDKFHARAIREAAAAEMNCFPSANSHGLPRIAGDCFDADDFPLAIDEQAHHAVP